MKKCIILLPLFFAVVSMVFAENVTIQTAQTAAQSFLNSKMEGNPQIQLIDFAERASFQNFYIFGNENCFVIIAGDDCVHPVLGYSTENAFETDGMPQEVFCWLMRYEDALVALSDTRVEASSDVQAEWKCLLNGRGLEPKTRTRVMPLIKTKWSHKKAPFNNLCPADSQGPDGHARGGCGAGAMSQLMNYWEHPVRGIGEDTAQQPNHPEYGPQYANFGETIYDWDNMKNVYANGYNDAEALAVATLIYQCAVSLHMRFGPKNSYTDPSKIVSALIDHFDYSPTTTYKKKSDYDDATWKSMIKDDLDFGRPVIYRGRDVTDTLGHIFICDGYDENDYFHFNFDWAGSYDGYYLIGGIYVGNDYDHKNTAVFNCYPNPTSIIPPINVATTVDNQNVTISWSTVSDASYYKLYCDENLIANNLHSTCFIDNNVTYGVHSYYVKSVKSDGTMSLRSNVSVADVHFSGSAPTDLEASVNGNNVDLSWQIESPESAVLQYATVYDSIGGGGTDSVGTRTSWAQRFPVSMLQEYAGMAIEKVEFYVRSDKFGEYTVGIYKGDETNVTELVYQQSYNATYRGWHEILFPSPVTIDYTQDLWIVFYSSVYKPTSMCYYSGSGHYDALLYSNTQSGVLNWQRLTYERAWMMKTYITDGSYTSESATLQYGLGYCIGGGGFNQNQNDNPDYYWAHRYPVSTLQQYTGMGVKKVSFYFRTEGAYTLFVYNGNEMQPTELLHQQNYTATAGSWQDIIFDTPIEIDYTQDLWIVFHSNVRRPASCCVYDDVTDARLYSYDGVTWRYNFSQNELRSWLIKTYLTDGTYTYNLYRNGEAVATNLNDNTYTDTNLPDGIYDYHVTTNYFGGESDPSNTVHVQIGEAITQTTDFNNGWTWWSPYVETSGNDVLDQLKTGLGESGVVIKSHTQSTMHMGDNWVGSLNMNNEGGYMVKSDEEVAVDITGSAATPENHPITLNSGWTWIGYPCAEQMTVAEALANHTPQPNDVVKGQNVSAMYMGGQWYGSLTLTPGIGLMYKSNNSEVVTLTYATPSRMTEIEANAVETHWNANYSAYPTNMMVLAVVELDGEELNSKNYELAVFANSECRGSVAMMYVEPLDRYMALLTIAGEEVDNLCFALYNAETGEEYHDAIETLTYEMDAVVGSSEAPFVVRFRNTGVGEWANSLQIFPNPVERGQIVSIGMTDETGEVRVEIVNVMGVVEKNQTESLPQGTVKAPDESGVYVLRITVEGKGACYRKLVVK